VYGSPLSGALRPQKAMPECISDSTSFTVAVRRKSVNLRLVSRYVLTLISSVFFAMMVPSLIDHNFSWPSQPSKSLPLNRRMTSVLPLSGGTSGALSFSPPLGLPLSLSPASAAPPSTPSASTPALSSASSPPVRFMVAPRPAKHWLSNAMPQNNAPHRRKQPLTSHTVSHT